MPHLEPRGEDPREDNAVGSDADCGDSSSGEGRCDFSLLHIL